LLITVSLLPGGSACRDEADYFIPAFFSNGVGHKQYSHPSSKTERLPALLSGFVGAVLLEQGIRILKDVHGVLKADVVFP